MVYASSFSFLHILMMFMGLKVQVIAGKQCIPGSEVTTMSYSDTIVNHTIVGPVLSNITAKNERECKSECHLAELNLCYMFNYHPSSKVCELLYKDRAPEYKVEKKKGSTFKTRKCITNPCQLLGDSCYSLGDQNNNTCIFFGKECPNGWVAWRTKTSHFCYLLVKKRVTWPEAQNGCGSRSANLLSLGSQEEVEFIKNNVENRRAVWIGANDKKTEGVWQWTDGTNFTLSHLIIKNGDNGENCARITGDDKWEDFPCGTKLYYICKKVP